MSAETRDGSVFGLWLRRRRRQLGMTQVELARRVGCSVATVRKLEADERHPSRRVALSLASALGVPEDEHHAFVRFARSGWADQAPASPEPELEHPWLDPPHELAQATRQGAEPLLAPAEMPAAPDRPSTGTSVFHLQPRLPDATLWPPRLVGRGMLWEEMEQAWQAGRHIFLQGPGGVGKTRLMTDFVSTKGASIVGEGSPGDFVLPLVTVQRLFRRFFARWPAATSELPIWVRAEASRFLPELYPEPPPPVRDETQRSRFFEAQLHMTLVLASRVAMAVGDDLQYWDPSSFEVQSWVTAQIVRRRMTDARSIAAFRPHEMPGGYLDRTEELTRSGVAVLLDVMPLPSQRVDELLAVLEVPPGEIDAIEMTALTGGNPMLVIEAVKAWWETRARPVGERPADVVSIGAERTIRARLDRLDPGDRWLAQAMAVLQEAATPELLADVLGESRWLVAERLARLEVHNIVRRVRFVHDLLAEGALGTLSGPQRRLLHARSAEALNRGAAEPALVAHHLEQAGRTQQALAWRLDAAERALEQGSRIEAQRWLAAVLDHVPEGSEDAARAGVLLGHAWRATDADAACGAFSRALDSARRAVSPALEARALAGLAQVEALRGHDGEAREHDRAASELAWALPGADRARLLLDLSEVRWAIGDFGESEERIAETVRLEPDQPRYRLALARSHWHRGRFQAAVDELQGVLRSHPASARLTPVLLDLGQNQRALGMLESAVRWLERARSVWRDSGDLLRDARVREALGIAYTGRGALAAADWELRAAGRLYRRHGTQARVPGVASKRAYVRLLAGDPEAAYLVCRADGDANGYPYRRCEWLAVLGVTLAGLGRHQEAREATDAAVALAESARHPLTQTTALRCRAEVAIAAGEPTLVKAATEALLELTRRHEMREQEAWAHVLAAEGCEHGEPEVARSHAVTALELAVEHGYLPVEARVAEFLARLGDDAMVERAAALRARMGEPPLPALTDNDEGDLGDPPSRSR